MQEQVTMTAMAGVFKTGVHHAATAMYLVALLEAHHPGARITFDLDDCDRILRVAPYPRNATAIVDLLESCGYFCEEL